MFATWASKSKSDGKGVLQDGETVCTSETFGVVAQTTGKVQKSKATERYPGGFEVLGTCARAMAKKDLL